MEGQQQQQPQQQQEPQPITQEYFPEKWDPCFETVINRGFVGTLTGSSLAILFAALGRKKLGIMSFGLSVGASLGSSFQTCKHKFEHPDEFDGKLILRKKTEQLPTTTTTTTSTPTTTTNNNNNNNFQQEQELEQHLNI